MPADAPTASAIVCTRNRADFLEGCLDTLLAERPAVPWEVILVDNDSTDATPSVVARCSERAPEVPFRYLVEKQPGLSSARNRGVAAAAGRYLLFTDDDVLVEPGWVDALCAGFHDDEVRAVAGRVVPEWPARPPAWILGRHAGLLALTDLGDVERDLTGPEVPVGANMAIRASELPAPAFDPRLGHQGNTFFAYEEYEVFRRLRSSGRVVYRPDAVVRHRILPERMTWEGMRRAAVQNGFGSRRAERLRGEPTPRRAGAASALARTWASALRHSRRNGGRDDVTPDAAFAEIRAWWELGKSIEAVSGGTKLGEWLVTRATITAGLAAAAPGPRRAH